MNCRVAAHGCRSAFSAVPGCRGATLPYEPVSPQGERQALNHAPGRDDRGRQGALCSPILQQLLLQDSAGSTDVSLWTQSPIAFTYVLLGSWHLSCWLLGSLAREAAPCPPSTESSGHSTLRLLVYLQPTSVRTRGLFPRQDHQ